MPVYHVGMTAPAVVGIAAAGILGYDVVWPLAYLALPRLQPALDIALTVMAFVIPFGIGAVLARSESPTRAMWLTAVVGVVDSTLGWAISWQIGPGRVDAGEGSRFIGHVAITIVIVVAVYGACGRAGASISRRWMRQSARPGA